MAIFAVLGVTNAEATRLAVQNCYPSDHLELAPGQWLVATGAATAKEVSDRLGFTDGSRGNALVVSVGSYWGWSSKSVWDWLKVKVER